MLIKGLVYSIFIVMARTEMENYMAYTFSFTFTVMLEYDEKQVGTSIGLTWPFYSIDIMQLYFRGYMIDE